MSRKPVRSRSTHDLLKEVEVGKGNTVLATDDVTSGLVTFRLFVKNERFILEWHQWHHLFFQS